MMTRGRAGTILVKAKRACAITRLAELAVRSTARSPIRSTSPPRKGDATADNEYGIDKKKSAWTERIVGENKEVGHKKWER
jgi:hypothetical protein